jgi:hypothetical protein
VPVRRGVLGIDTLLVLLLVVANLGMNLNHFFDPLDAFRVFDEWPRLGPLLTPGGEENPLVFLGKKSNAPRLLIRSLSVLLLGLYLVLDLLAAGGGAGRASSESSAGLISGGRRFLRARWCLLVGLVVLLVVVPTLLTVLARWSGPHHELAHDGGTIQVEEAMRMVLRGQNPYWRTYHGTPLENWRGFTNSAVYHYPYFPFSFLQFIPLYPVIYLVFGVYDQRLAHLLLYAGSVVLGAALLRDRRRRLAGAAWIALNPFLTHDFVLGTNDIVAIFWVLLTWWLLARGRLRLGLIALACAAGSKQLALLLAPFVLVHVVRERGVSLGDVRGLWRLAAPFWGVLALIVAPFFLASPRSFIEDTFLYSSGGLPTSYPIQGAHGYGLGSILLFFRWIPNGNVRFPFWILQVVLCGPLLVLLLRRQWRAPGLPRVFAGFAVFLLAFMFFARYLHGNFLGFIITWLPLAYLAEEERDVRDLR